MADDEELVEPEPADMAWLLTFADLVSLLITFFVLLFSMKVVKQDVWQQLKGAFNGVFSVQQPLIHIQPEQDSGIEMINIIQSDNLDYLQGIIQNKFKDDPILSQTETQRDMQHDTLTLVLPSNLVFASGSSNMTQAGEMAVRRLGDQLRHFDNKIKVAGHTDPYPVASKRYPSNWELAMMRAIEVERMLKSEGVEGTIPVTSYGASRFDENEGANLSLEQKFQRARRVEVIIQSNASNSL